MPIYYPPTQDFLQRTLSSPIGTGATSLTLNSTSGIQNKPGVVIIDAVDVNGNPLPTKREVKTFTGVSGLQLVGLVGGLAGTTDQPHDAGAIVQFAPDIVWAQGFIDSFELAHNADGTHKSGIALPSPNISDWNGWLSTSLTWTRTADHTFTVPGDRTAMFRKGTKIRYKDGGGFEYGVVQSSSHSSGTTTVTLIQNSDYAMAAATITEPGISYVENPEGFPAYFSVTSGSFLSTAATMDNGSGGQVTPSHLFWSVRNGIIQFWVKWENGRKIGTDKFIRFTTGNMPPVISAFSSYMSLGIANATIVDLPASVNTITATTFEMSFASTIANGTSFGTFGVSACIAYQF